MNISFVAKAAGFGVAAAIALSIFFGSWQTIDEGDRGVKLRTGSVVDEVEPGLRFKLPFAENIVTYSVRTNKVRWGAAPKGSGEADSSIIAYSKDVQKVTIAVSVNYRLDANSVKDVYRKYGLHIEQTMLYPRVQKYLKEIVGAKSAADLVGQRNLVGKEFTEALTRDLPKEIILEGVQIENLDFESAYEQAAEKVAQMEAASREKDKELDRQKKQAEITVTDARAQADSVKLAADAEAHAIEVKAVAEAQGIREKAKALAENSNLVNYTAALTWDGKLPQTMVPGSTVPFIDVNRINR